ncbi:cobalamin B12-binding domain-containing protein [Nocardioides sp. MAHUQ-72]|uniref:cobalamin B12-binding domain-containing protein n=1 Tax=unclassified Nocardioides TaxID=2615069 RepID=UPI00361647DD
MNEEYWQALEAGDRHAALTVVKRLHESGQSPLAIIDELVVPAQERVGELWLDGAWSVTQEHAATAINEGLVHWLGSFVPEPEPDRPLVLVSCIEGERHALPALVVAEALGMAGHRVSYVGGDPEPHDLLRQVLVLKPRAVLFSASLTSSLAPQKGLFGSIRAIGIPVLVGGRAFGGDERRATSLGATAYAHGVDDVLRLLEELPERLPAAPRPPEGPADVEAAWILAHRGQITPAVVRAVERRYAVEGDRPRWWSELEGHVDHVLGCLAAALVTGDETIMIEVRDWFGRVLARRGAAPGLVEEVWHLLAGPLRGHPLARVFLAGSAAPSEGGISEPSV